MLRNRLRFFAFISPLLGAVGVCCLHGSAASAQVIASDGYFSPKIPLAFNGTAANLGSKMQLTSGVQAEAGSIFTRQMVGVWAFHTTFNFQLAKGSQGGDLNCISDGITFCIQNTSPKAFGGTGSNLGYSDVTTDGTGQAVSDDKIFPSSVAIKFDPIHLSFEDLDSNSETGLYTDGDEPFNGLDMLSDGGVDMTSQDMFQVTLIYSESAHHLAETVTDTSTGASYIHDYDIDIARTLGSAKAYVGFTGATGYNSGVQTVSAWAFNSDYFQNGAAISQPGTRTLANSPSGNFVAAMASLLSGYEKFASFTPDDVNTLLKPTGGDDAKLLQQRQLAGYYTGTDALATGQDVNAYLQQHIVGNRQRVLLRLTSHGAGASSPDRYVVILSRRPDGDWNVFDPGWTRDQITPTGAADTLSGHLKGFGIGGKTLAFTPVAAYLFAPVG